MAEKEWDWKERAAKNCNFIREISLDASFPSFFSFSLSRLREVLHYQTWKTQTRMSVETLKGLEAELSSWSPEELSVCGQKNRSREGIIDLGRGDQRRKSFLPASN